MKFLMACVRHIVKFDKFFSLNQTMGHFRSFIRVNQSTGHSIVLSEQSGHLYSFKILRKEFSFAIPIGKELQKKSETGISNYSGLAI